MNKNRSLSLSLIAVLVVGVLVLVLAAGGSAKKAPSGTTLGVKRTSLGKFLVGTGGRTLYLFAADKPGVSNLSAAGFAAWPAFAAAGAVHASGGASGAKLATITSRGAKHQLTYAGHPLYYFVGDQRTGATNGQALFEFGAKWYVVAPSGGAVTSAAPAPAPAAPAPARETSGPYGY
jgi:predicted lipoprotein with Yx(FWY)xxD motif